MEANIGALDLADVELVSVERTGEDRPSERTACELCGDAVGGDPWSLSVRERATRRIRTAPLCAPCADAYDWLVGVLRGRGPARTEAHPSPWRGGRR